MPNAAVKSYAKKTGKSTDTVEKNWDKAKQAAKDAGLTPGSDEYYAYTNAVTKRMSGISEEGSNFTPYFQTQKFIGESSMKKIQEIGYKQKDVIYDDFVDLGYDIETDVSMWGYKVLRMELIPLSSASPPVKQFIAKENYWPDVDVKDDRQIGYMELTNKVGKPLNLFFASRNWMSIGERMSPSGHEYLTFVLTDKTKRKFIAAKGAGKFVDILNALLRNKMLPESNSSTLTTYTPFFEKEETLKKGDIVYWKEFDKHEMYRAKNGISQGFVFNPTFSPTEVVVEVGPAHNPQKRRIPRSLLSLSERTISESIDTDVEIYDLFQKVLKRFPTADDYASSSMFRNLQIKFGDKLAQYVDTILMTRKIPKTNILLDKIEYLLPEGKMDLFKKVLQAYI